jgi:hypothetical protein
MRHADARGVAGRGAEIQTQAVAGLQPDLAVGELAQPELGSLQVGQDRERTTDEHLRLPHRGDGAGMVGMGAMAEVDPEDVGPGERQRPHLVDAAAGGTKGGDNAGSAGADHGVRLRLPEPS